MTKLVEFVSGNSVERNVTTTEMANRQPAISWTDIRQTRNTLLCETDYLMMPDYPLIQEPQRTNIETYRQALRDITDTFTTPDDVVWPSKPLVT